MIYPPYAFAILGMAEGIENGTAPTAALLPDDVGGICMLTDRKLFGSTLRLIDSSGVTFAPH